MNRLTRCPACTTIFRVTDEQLDSRQGFVRCGQCAKVFDARASLMEARDEPPPASAQGTYEDGPDASAPERMLPSEHGAVAPYAARAQDTPSSTEAAPSEEEGDPFEGMDVEEIVLSLDGPDPDEANVSPAPEAGMPAEAVDAAPAPEADAAPAAESASSAEPAIAPVAAPIVRPSSAADDDEPLPFGPKHRARSRAAAAAWGVGALLLLAVLAAQGGVLVPR